MDSPAHVVDVRPHLFRQRAHTIGADHREDRPGRQVVVDQHEVLATLCGFVDDGHPTVRFPAAGDQTRWMRAGQRAIEAE